MILSPLAFSYSKWPDEIVRTRATGKSYKIVVRGTAGNNQSSPATTIIQIDAAVIVGALFFL
jgi:hypothetical protein